MNDFRIKNRKLESGLPTYFIADIAANHDGNLTRALDLISLAKEAGADCAKFQHFESSSIISDTGFRSLNSIDTHQSSWDKSVSEIYDIYHTRREWDMELITKCEQLEIDFMTTPYNFDAVDRFEKHLAAFKVGSGDITYLPLLEKLASYGKPVFLATGASNMGEVDAAVNVFRKKAPLCLMQCNTNYTGSLQNFNYVNLRVLKTFAEKFPNLVLGLSDHTPGFVAVLGAVSLGASAIEKHFTDDTGRVGPDHAFSMDPNTWKEMVERTRELEACMGDGIKRVEENEINTNIVQRRAIRIKFDVGAGHIVNFDDLEFLRPCDKNDISPSFVKKILGMKIVKPLKRGEALTWRNLKN